MNQKQAGRKANKTGELFERELIATNKKYAMQKIGMIEKIPIGIRAIPTQRGVRWVPAEKTGCDFIGHYKGIPVAIEAKSTANKTAFQLFTHGKPMIMGHQVRFLERYEASGGKAYVLIKFNPIRRYFRVPIGIYTQLHQSAVKAGKKSINIKLLEEYETKIQDYMEG